MGGVDADLTELVVGPVDLPQRGRLGACDENQSGAGRILEGFDCRGVGRPLFVQAGQRPQTGRVAFAGLEEVGPRAGKLEQSDGVAGGGGVEEDMVVGAVERWVGQEGGELVERGDLDRAGP